MAELIPVKTRRLNPPQDALFDALLSGNLRLQEKDVLILSSKVIAIDEGRCIPKEESDKTSLVEQEADCHLPKSLNTHGFELSIIHHALIPSAGVDSSNCGDFYTLLPKDPFLSARNWHTRLTRHFDIENLGIIIADSHCIPMRWGVVDISIGFWGLCPVRDYRETEDLFGNRFSVSQDNLVDSIAAAAGSIMGQGTESTPAVIARNWPNLTFDANTNYKDQFVIDRKEDIFNVMLDVFDQKGVVKEK